MAKSRLLLISTFIAALLAAPLPVAAQQDPNQDLKTISKALGFIDGNLLGDVDMAVVFNPNEPSSVSHANEICNEQVTENKNNKIVLKTRKISVTAIHQDKPKVIFITRDMKKYYEEIFSYARSIGAITISTEEECLSENGCVMVVKSKPHIDILVNTELARITGTEFSSAFSMMITRK